MLVLSRKVGQKVVVGDDIVLVINRISGNRVSIGIEAPHDVRIVRAELPIADLTDSQPVVDQFESAAKMSPGSNAAVAACD